MGICRGLDGRVFGLKIFEPSEENPYLCSREQCRPEGFTIHVICCVIFVLLGDSKLIAWIVISPCELILVLLT